MYGILAFAAISCSIMTGYGDQIKNNNNDPIPDTIMVVTNVYASPIEEVVIYDEIMLLHNNSQIYVNIVFQKTLILALSIDSDADT